ncbi:LCP family protein required for cell wall assembly [Pseudoclavibacter chungangensis]|nr:LCP family protein [Pseudoclavibacter chungangensis]NYJ67679.1 LCP family protein required for cell wall assembly [Pseudoclavibacter chungangensis]
MMTATPSLRTPDTGDARLMTRRAWWLVLGNFVLPGTAQVVAGNRRFGRFMLGLWLTGIVLLVVVGVCALVFRAPILVTATSELGIRAVVLVMWIFIACWFLSQIDALRLTRLIKLDALARPLIAIIAVVLAIVPSIVGLTAGNVANQVASTVHTLFGGDSAGIKWPTDGRINILLLGGDRGADREGLRPDSISVMSFDVLTGRSTTIGIPRNTESFPFADGPMKERYPDGYNDCDVDVCYINSVYTEVQLYHTDLYPDAAAKGSEPGIEATKEAVEGITGLQIHYFALIDMAGFAELIDALGGVTIDVTEKVWLGINDDGSEGWTEPTEYIDVGVQKMDGATALWYARSRYNTTDYARMERQRELQAAIIAEMTPANLASRIGPVTDAVEKLVETDMPEGEAGMVADLLLRSRSQPQTTLELVPPLVDPANPDIDVVQQAIQDSFTADPEPTATTDDGSSDSGG